jgi:hypothetical protein
MSTSENIHHVRKIKIVHCDPISETGRKTIDLTAQFDVTAWSDTPTLTEKEMTFFLAESFEGITFDDGLSSLFDWHPDMKPVREPSSLEDRKNAAAAAINDAIHGGPSIDHSKLLSYIAELYRRLETADPTFSLDG